MTPYNLMFSLCVGILCIVSFGLSQNVTPMPPGNPGSNPPNMGRNNIGPSSTADRRDNMADSRPDQQQQQLPVWLKCMADSTGQDVSDADTKGVFESWCSNYETIVQCLATNLGPSAETNPFDFFISLEFDPARLMDVSKEYCSMLKAASDQLKCTTKQNQTLATVCGHAFTRGLFHIYGLFKEKNAPQDVLSKIACDVTTQTSFCLRQSLAECPSDVQTTLLNYYDLFTNGTCIAPHDYQPPSPPPKRPDTVVVKCAEEAAQTLKPEQSGPEPSSVVDFVVLELKSDCKTYPTRFSCYDRELRNITNFLDLWLSLTFDYENAIASQKTYCGLIEDLVIPGLSTECFNKSQPALAACEVGFRHEVETIGKEWVENPDFDGVQLQTLACRTSVTRATCLGDTMKHCGDEVARAMAVSEMGILPDVCRQLLADDNSNKGDNNERPMNDNRVRGHSNRGHPMNGEGNAGEMMTDEKPMGDMGYKGDGKEMKVAMENENKMKGGNGNGQKSTSESQKNANADGGVEVLHANKNVLAFILAAACLFFVL